MSEIGLTSTFELARILLFQADHLRRFLRGECGPPPFMPDGLEPELVAAIAKGIEILEAFDAEQSAIRNGSRPAKVLPFTPTPQPTGDADDDDDDPDDPTDS
jgi:hypothetical protein